MHCLIVSGYPQKAHPSEMISDEYISKADQHEMFSFYFLDCWRKLQYPLLMAATMLESRSMTGGDCMNIWSISQITCMALVTVSLHIKVIFKSVYWKGIYWHDVCKVNDISCLCQVIWKLNLILHVLRHLAFYCKITYFNIILIYVTTIEFSVFLF